MSAESLKAALDSKTEAYDGVDLYTLWETRILGGDAWGEFKKDILALIAQERRVAVAEYKEIHGYEQDHERAEVEHAQKLRLDEFTRAILTGVEGNVGANEWDSINETVEYCKILALAQMAENDKP